MSNKEYDISAQTLRDIVNNIPSDKWDLVMRDMSAMLVQAKSLIDLIEVAGQVVIDDSFKAADIIQLQESIKWVDDGKCENEIGFVDEDGNGHGSIKFGEDKVTFSEQ